MNKAVSILWMEELPQITNEAATKMIDLDDLEIVMPQKCLSAYRIVPIPTFVKVCKAIYRRSDLSTN